MAPDWFEKDNFKRTVQQLLIDALSEMEVEFHRLDPVVQTTLLDEAMQVGVQRSLEPLMRIKAVMEGANADENFLKQMITEICAARRLFNRRKRIGVITADAATPHPRQ